MGPHGNTKTCLGRYRVWARNGNSSPRPQIYATIANLGHTRLLNVFNPATMRFQYMSKLKSNPVFWQANAKSGVVYTLHWEEFTAHFGLFSSLPFHWACLPLPTTTITSLNESVIQMWPFYRRFQRSVHTKLGLDGETIAREQTCKNCRTNSLVNRTEKLMSHGTSNMLLQPKIFNYLTKYFLFLITKELWNATVR